MKHSSASTDTQKFSKEKSNITPLSVSIKNIFLKSIRSSPSNNSLNNQKDVPRPNKLPTKLSTSSLIETNSSPQSHNSSHYTLYVSDHHPVTTYSVQPPKLPMIESTPKINLSAVKTSKIRRSAMPENMVNIISSSIPLSKVTKAEILSSNISKSSTITAHVVKADISLKSNKNSGSEKLYKIVVARGPKKWSIQKTYGDFWKLYINIKENFPQKKLSNFPQRQGILGYSFPSDFVFTKRDKINTLIQSFLSDADISSCPAIEGFFAPQSDSSLKSQITMIDYSSGSDNQEYPTDPNAKIRTIRSLYKLRKKTRNFTTNGFDIKPFNFGTEPTITKHRSLSQILNTPSSNSLGKQLKRPRQNTPKAMRKRFGFRRGVQVVGNSNSQSSESTKSKNDTLATNKIEKSQHVHSDNSYYTDSGESVNNTENTFMQIDTIPNLKRNKSAASISDNEVESDEIELDVELMSRRKHKVNLDDFHLLSIIGKGSYGSVMLARHKDTAKVYAIKAISKERVLSKPGDIKRVMLERQVLKQVVHHPFLVGLEYAFQTSTKLYFCLDYVNGGELFYHLQREIRFSENRSRFYVSEIISAIGYLHELGIIYRDLKPENCLLDAHGHVRIVDFGLVKILDKNGNDGLTNNRTFTFCGTPEYLTPEVLMRQPYGKEVDWYCLGAILYEMIVGLPPFYSTNPTEMYNSILNDQLRFPPPSQTQPSIGNLTKDFITKLMNKHPTRRLGYGPNGTENIKRHLYFYGINWKKIYNLEYQPPFIPEQSSIFDLTNISPEFRNQPIPESILNEGKVSLISNIGETNKNTSFTQNKCKNSASGNICTCTPSCVPNHQSTSYFPELLSGDHISNHAALVSAINQVSTASDKNGTGTKGENAINVDDATEAFRGFSFDSVRY
ncbi:hypothetical protein BB559_001428 [Furculomyces boomerangus]|uniref:Protein kinase domain-containing protein n=2 Tax=Harpellales TaxID=61421 RepID=A0A2T9Z1Z8_9FUNG|nr:hypothetical protein BB559_001428 [Furculomyces boomerangus]PWA03616.1 hypothetical protein BB558_000263 [Smittium angustum]